MCSSDLAGAAEAGRSLTDIDLQAGGSVAFGDRGALLDRFRPGVAFPVGAMGSRRNNFYREAFVRAGFADACEEIARLWLDGKRDEATARVPDEMVIGTTLIGTDAEVTERIDAYRRAGITTLRVQPEGRTPTERLDTLARVIDLVRAGDPA